MGVHLAQIERVQAWLSLLEKSLNLQATLQRPFTRWAYTRLWNYKLLQVKGGGCETIGDLQCSFGVCPLAAEMHGSTTAVTAWLPGRS